MGDAVLLISHEQLKAIVCEAVQTALEGRGDIDPWIPHQRWPWPRRVALRLAKELGASRNGRTWMLKKSELDRVIESRRVAPKAKDADIGDFLLEMTSRAARKIKRRT